MKVRELLEALSKLNPDAEVFCHRGDGVFPQHGDEGVYATSYVYPRSPKQSSQSSKVNIKEVFGKEEVAVITVIGFPTTPKTRNARRRELQEDIARTEANIPQSEPWRGDVVMTIDAWKAELQWLGHYEQESVNEKAEKAHTKVLSVILDWLR